MAPSVRAAASQNAVRLTIGPRRRQSVGWLPVSSGDRDLMIASIALANRLTVVTSNVSEFSRVQGLRVEDWMA
jgi:predicted nucleic acid-binding protein